MPHSKASLTVLPGGRRVLEPPSEFGEGSIERSIFMAQGPLPARAPTPRHQHRKASASSP